MESKDIHIILGLFLVITKEATVGWRYQPTVASLVESVQDFLIELDMKAYIYLGGFQLVDSKYNGAYTTRDLL